MRVKLLITMWTRQWQKVVDIPRPSIDRGGVGVVFGKEPCVHPPVSISVSEMYARMSPILLDLSAAFNIADHLFLEKNLLASVTSPLQVFLLHCWTLLRLFLVSSSPGPPYVGGHKVSDAALHSGHTPIQPPGFKYYPCSHDDT